MRRYFCDVCGAALPARRENVATAKPTGQAAELCGLEDLCEGCVKLAAELDVPALVMEELRRRKKKEGKKPKRAAAAGSAGPPPAPVLAGPAAKERRGVLEALERARRELGPGAVSAVAERSGVDEAVIRDMIARARVPMASGRAGGKALGVPGSGAGETLL